MAEIYNTPIAKLYQSMIDNGVFVPVEVSSNFRYPSKVVHVATVATNGTVGGDSTSGVSVAKLVTNFVRDK